MTLNIFKALSSFQPLLNLSKYKSEDQEINFEDLHFFSITIIVHSLFYCALCTDQFIYMYWAVYGVYSTTETGLPLFTNT